MEVNAPYPEILAMWDTVTDLIDEAHVDRIEDEAREFIASNTRGYTVYYWSGGKDSLVIGELCRGLVADGYLFMEADAFLFTGMADWYDTHTPDQVYRDDGGWTLDTLADDPRLLFPDNQDDYAMWDRNKWKHQHAWRRRVGADAVVTGRRNKEGNFCGKRGIGLQAGATIINPIHAWTFPEVLAYLAHRGIDLPPCYRQHDLGFVYGTAPWAKFKFPNRDTGWKWLREADPTVYDATIELRRALNWA